ncbi:MAG: YihY/virulence factor BrkB family protein [Spartobacteria bacterium]
MHDQITSNGPWPLLKNTAIEWWNDNTFRLAASLAFYTIFSLAPILLITVGAASLFFSRQTAVDSVAQEIQRLVGEQGAGAIRQVLESAGGLGQGAWAITVGVITLILGASVVFAELQSALNQIWGVKSEVRRGLILDLAFDRLRSFSIALGVGFLLLVSLVLSAALSALQDYMTNWMPSVPWLWQAGNIVISLIVVAVLFAMIYKYLPDVQIKWRDVWIGAAFTSILFNGGKYLISIYLGHAAIGSAFGAAGSFAVLLVWIYYSALICFFGAEFTQVYARRHGRQLQPEDHARRIDKRAEQEN